MNSRLLIGAAIIALLFVGGLFFFSRQHSNQPASRPAQVSNAPAAKSLKQVMKPTPSPISKPAPLETKTFSGTVLSVTQTKLSVKTVSAGNQDFIFSKDSEIYRLIGGTLA